MKQSKKLKRKLRKKARTYKKYKGGRKFDSFLDIPHMLTYRDILDNSDFIHEIKKPNDINSYKPDNVYLWQPNSKGKAYDDHMWYYKIRVKSIDTNSNTMQYVPALAKGKKYAPVAVLTLNVNRIGYAYEIHT